MDEAGLGGPRREAAHWVGQVEVDQPSSVRGRRKRILEARLSCCEGAQSRLMNRIGFDEKITRIGKLGADGLRPVPIGGAHIDDCPGDVAIGGDSCQCGPRGELVRIPGGQELVASQLEESIRETAEISS